MKKKLCILLVEDEKSTCGYISNVLTANEYNVLVSSKGQEAISMAASYCPDLVLLNLGLPDMSGMEVLRAIRMWSDMPILILSTRVCEEDKVGALDAGADDYIVKPFCTAELLARIRVAFRHCKKGTQGAAPVCMIGPVRIDYGSRSVTAAGKEIHLTPTEYKVLVLLSQNAGKALSHEYMIKEIWGPFTSETYSSELQALRVNIANIRKKLEPDPARPRYILTETGVGYRMAAR